MTDQQKTEITNQIEIDLLEKVDIKVKDKFDSFKQVVDSAYTFHTSIIKNALWIIGISLTTISLLLAFFGIKTYGDIQTTIKSNVEKELSSDQVIKQYRDELTSLKSKLIINEIEQNIAVTNVYGKSFYRKSMSEEYLQILNQAIDKKDNNSIKCIQVLNKYDDFVNGYDYISEKLTDDIQKISNDEALIQSVYTISNEENNSLLQKESYNFLISYGSTVQIENIINQLKDHIINKKTSFSSVFKDNAEGYLVRLIFKVKKYGLNTANRKDIIEVCKSASKFEDDDIQLIGLLGLATLTNQKVEDIIFKKVVSDKSKIDNLLSVINSYSRYFYNRNRLLNGEIQVYNPKFLSTIFDVWSLDKMNKSNYIYFEWVPLSNQESLYNALFKQIISKQSSTAGIIWVIRTFVPDEIYFFNEKSFKDLPILKIKEKGKYFIASFDFATSKLKDENGDEIKPDNKTEFLIQLKPNPNFESDDVSN